MPLTLTEAISDSVDVTDVLARLLVFSRALTGTVGVTDSLGPISKHPRTFTGTVGITEVMTRIAGHPRSFADTVGITDVLHISIMLNFADTVGITDRLRLVPAAHFTDTVGITNTMAVTGRFVQMDTWRPVPKPDNTMVLVCRTPEGSHDSESGHHYMTFWALSPDGDWERPCVLAPSLNGYGWQTFRHPEWAPDGNKVIFIAETATEWKLVTLDSSGFGQ